MYIHTCQSFSRRRALGDAAPVPAPKIRSGDNNDNNNTNINQ